MNKYTLQFQNKSLENEYFNRVALPHYYKIFSMWCKCLIVISIPAALFTFFTGNLQYFGFTFAACTSTLSLIVIKFKKSTFNVVAALYNASFVVLNFIFLTITDRRLGVEGDYERIMYVFAGSQYTFHSILSMGTNVILTSTVIIIQNVTYSVVFYPGNINLLHGLLLFATCFLIWTKYHIEKQKRKNFLLQENEKEWSLFVRDVLPSSVIMVKYDKGNDTIKTKLVNRASRNNFHIKDEESMKQFIRNTHIWSESKDKQLDNQQNTRPSLMKSIFKNGMINSETLENYIFYRFKLMDREQTKVGNNKNNLKCNLKQQSDININESYQNSKSEPNYALRKSMQLDHSQLSSNVRTKNQYVDKNNKQKSKIVENKKETDFDFGTHTTEDYNFEQYKAKLMKNNKLVEVLIKIVFYNLSYPVCSISIDENLKQKVHNISKLSHQKEKIYFEHFQKIINKFTRVINTKDVKLIHPISLMHLNHLRNLRDLIILKQQNMLKINYSKFELNSLLSYIQNIYQNYFQSIGVKFTIAIKKEQFVSNNQYDKSELNDKKDLQEIDKNINYLIKCNKEEEDFSNLQMQKQSEKEQFKEDENSQISIQNQGCDYKSLNSFDEKVEIFNDQQRICQVIINLIENANDYLQITNLKEKEIKLFVKIISGCDEASNLLEFKVLNNLEDYFPKDRVNNLKLWLKEERESSNFNLIWKSITYFQPTQLGLRLNQKILEKISPFNYLNLETPEQSFEASFLIYQDSTILQNSPNKIFQNKFFENIRESNLGLDLQNNIQIPIQDNLAKSNMNISNISFTYDKPNSQFDQVFKNFLQIPLKDNQQKLIKQSINLTDPIDLSKNNKYSEIDMESSQKSYQNLSYNDGNIERSSDQSIFIKHFESKKISDLNLLNIKNSIQQ